MAFDPSLIERVVVEARRLRAWSRALTEDTRRLRAAGTIARVEQPIPPDPWSSPSLHWRAATVVPQHRSFAVAGIIDAWDSVSREVTMGTRTFTVDAEVSVVGLARDRQVLMSGHRDTDRSAHLVTRLIVRPVPLASPAPG
jgi:hypothetical protein